jgi:hypothetical protein
MRSTLRELNVKPACRIFWVFSACGGIGVEEPVADDLAGNLLSAHVVGLRSWLAALQGPGALLTIEPEQLKIPLHAQTVLGCGLSRAQSFALALDEHGEALSDLVVWVDGELTAWSSDQLLGQVEVHESILSRGSGTPESRRFSRPQERISEAGT